MEAVRAQLHYADYAVMAGYFLILFWMGWRHSGSVKDSRGFLLGGGRMPVMALAISCLMASLSAFSIVMVPGEIYSHGLSLWVFNLIAPVVTIATCAVFMRFYFKLGAFTPFEYLERRYDGKVRTLIASLTIYLRMIYLGMVLFSTTKVFEGAAGWPAWWTVLLCGGVAMAFTATGGLKAVVWSDVLQFGLLLGGLGCILAVLSWKIDGGLTGAVSYAFANGRGLDQFAKPEFYTLNPYVRLSFWLLLIGQTLAPVTAMASDQMQVQRLLASGSYQNALRTQVANTLVTIPTIMLLWLIGLGVFAFFHQRPDLTVASGDTALFTFVATQLPTPLPGIVIAAMLAAVISTLNAVFNSMATIYVKEIHLRHIHPGMGEPEQVRLSRLATLAVGAVAVGLGLFISLSAGWLRQSVVEAQTIFYAFDAIVIPAFLFAVFSRKASVRLVWVTAGLLWGLKLAMITWYSASTHAANTWQPGEALGWGGAFPAAWIAPPTVIGALLLGLWLAGRRRWRYASAVMVAGYSFWGYGAGLALWAFFSRWYANGEPLPLSFQWVGFPAIVCYTVVGVVWLTFGKTQPEEKYKGMTLFDAGN